VISLIVILVLSLTVILILIQSFLYSLEHSHSLSSILFSHISSTYLVTLILFSKSIVILSLTVLAILSHICRNYYSLFYNPKYTDIMFIFLLNLTLGMRMQMVL
jgi:hypothetical protein